MLKTIKICQINIENCLAYQNNQIVHKFSIYLIELINLNLKSYYLNNILHCIYLFSCVKKNIKCYNLRWLSSLNSNKLTISTMLICLKRLIYEEEMGICQETLETLAI